MVIYFFPLTFLTLIFLASNISKYKNFFSKKITYYSVCIFFIIFICFRYEIGCDWTSYQYKFNLIEESSIRYILKNQNIFFDLGFSFIAKSISYFFGFKELILVYGLLFTIPLFLFFENLKNKYLALIISYPYFIVVVGMGPIRQSAAIGFFMLSLLYFLHNENKKFYISSLLSILLHHSAIFFIGLLTLFKIKYENLKIDLLGKIFLIFTFMALIYISPEILSKIFVYIKYVKFGYMNAKGAIFVWFINFLPLVIYLLNSSKFKIKDNLKKFFKLFSIIQISIFPFLFVNSTIAYRLLIYFFPASIYLSAYLPEIKTFVNNKLFSSFILIFLAYFSLAIWLKLAFHNYCWIPYKNILFN